jgi:hypothetical protein
MMAYAVEHVTKTAATATAIAIFIEVLLPIDRVESLEQ